MATTTTLYVYDTETEAPHPVVARIHGGDNETCEQTAISQGYTGDRYGWTYSPALGSDDGLRETDDAIDIESA